MKEIALKLIEVSAVTWAGRKTLGGRWNETAAHALLEEGEAKWSAPCELAVEARERARERDRAACEIEWGEAARASVNDSGNDGESLELFR